MRSDLENSSENYLLEVRGLRKLFPVSRGLVGTLLLQPPQFVRAVDGISFAIRKGEILSVVGESGSGKTTSALCCTGLLPISEGKILLEGKDVFEMADDRQQRHKLRQSVQMIFQDPYESLNPRQNVFDTVAEPLEVHHLVSNQAEKIERVSNALEDAGLKPPKLFFDRLPQELSGGQRQRVVIASGLVLHPKLLIADEPVSMLDVSIRAEILNLLLRLRDERDITILYITHDLATTAYIADRVAVMYLGVIVEMGPAKSVIGNPYHPYTQALMSVIPVPNPRRRKARLILQGEIPNPINVPPGCRFHPRCPVAIDECSSTVPALGEFAPDHFAACILPKEFLEERNVSR
jgi:oligopeptide/dipeptide ABC transporter ATP-binding protein